MLTSQQLAKGLEHLNFMQHTIQATEDPLGLLYLVFPDLIFGVFCLFPGIGRKISKVMIETMLLPFHRGFAGLIHQSYHRNCLNLDPICFIFFEQIQPSIDVASNLFFLYSLQHNKRVPTSETTGQFKDVIGRPNNKGPNGSSKPIQIQRLHASKPIPEH